MKEKTARGCSSRAAKSNRRLLLADRHKRKGKISMSKVGARVKQAGIFAGLYKAFGVSFISNGDPANLRAEVCPFCDGDKFHVNVDDGTYQCLHANRCGVKGNAYTFIRWAHQECLEKTTTTELYHDLQERLGLSMQTLKRFGFAWNSWQDCWLIPYRSAKGEIVNLLRYWPQSKKKHTLAGLGLRLFGLDKLATKEERKKRTLIVCEGPLDLIALDQHLLKKKTRNRYDLVSIPSANVFRIQWFKYLRGYKEVRLCLDNDKAGRDGQARIAELAKEAKFSTNILALEWPKEYPEKCDIRDLVRANESVVEFTNKYCKKVSAGKPAFLLTRLDAVDQPQVLSWLWEEHIPLGSFVSFQGGQG